MRAALIGATKEAESVRAGGDGRCNFGAFLLALVLLWPCVLVQAQAPTSKVGYVDLKRLIDDAPQMIASHARLQEEFAPRDAALKADEAKLATLKQKQARDSAILSKADADALQRQVQALEHSVARTRENLRTELNARAAAERDRIWQQINDTVIDYARSHGYDLIVPSPVVYANPRIDITDAVLELLRHPKPAGAGKTP